MFVCCVLHDEQLSNYLNHLVHCTVFMSAFNSINTLMGICQISLLQNHFNICSALNETKPMY